MINKLTNNELKIHRPSPVDWRIYKYGEL